MPNFPGILIPRGNKQQQQQQQQIKSNQIKHLFSFSSYNNKRQ
jgi:hypothetical protein